MAKKSTRKKRKQRQANVPQYTPPTEPQEAAGTVAAQSVKATAAPARTGGTTGAGMDSVDWRAEYPYVVGDLRSMAVVAALMVALLLGLNFFLN